MLLTRRSTFFFSSRFIATLERWPVLTRVQSHLSTAGSVSHVKQYAVKQEVYQASRQDAPRHSPDDDRSLDTDMDSLHQERRARNREAYRRRKEEDPVWHEAYKSRLREYHRRKRMEDPEGINSKQRNTRRRRREKDAEECNSKQRAYMRRRKEKDPVWYEEYKSKQREYKRRRMEEQRMTCGVETHSSKLDTTPLRQNTARSPSGYRSYSTFQTLSRGAHDVDADLHTSSKGQVRKKVDKTRALHWYEANKDGLQTVGATRPRPRPDRKEYFRRRYYSDIERHRADELERLQQKSMRSPEWAALERQKKTKYRSENTEYRAQQAIYRLAYQGSDKHWSTHVPIRHETKVRLVCSACQRLKMSVIVWQRRSESDKVDCHSCFVSDHEHRWPVGYDREGSKC